MATRGASQKAYNAFQMFPLPLKKHSWTGYQRSIRHLHLLMGYRSLICIYHNGKLVVVHLAQFDGYPDVQGANILQFLLVQGNIQKLKDGLKFVDRDDGRYYDERDNPLPNFPPSLSSGTSGAQLLGMITRASSEERVPICLSVQLIEQGSLIYVVDLDEEVFEVCDKENRKCQEPSDRFVDLGGPQFMKSFHFSNLPIVQEFIEFFEEDEDDDESIHVHQQNTWTSAATANVNGAAILVTTAIILAAGAAILGTVCKL